MAQGGKWDRCQLGEWKQVQDLEQLDKTMDTMVSSSTQSTKLVDTIKEKHQNDFIEKCLEIATKTAELTIDDVGNMFMSAARCDSIVLTIMKHCGFRAMTCFSNFDLDKAAYYIVVAMSPLLREAKDSMRTNLCTVYIHVQYIFGTQHTVYARYYISIRIIFFELHYVTYDA